MLEKGIEDQGWVYHHFRATKVGSDAAVSMH